MIIWNPWHGCRKVSEGCQHCYMYFLDSRRGVDTSRVFRTENFDLPLQRRRDGSFRIKPGSTLHVGLSTDFFIEEADQWREEAWEAIRQRPDVFFLLLTKRPQRFAECLPADWGEGYENVMLSVTAENQRRADERLPILLGTPAKHRGFMAAPFIGPLDAEKYLATGLIEQVLCGGENYDGARPCHFDWVETLSFQCRAHGVTFDFIETGTVFVKDGKTYHIPDKRMQSRQAFRSGLSFEGRKVPRRLRMPEGSLFGAEVPEAEPQFREICATCGTRMTCSGCSGCGACEKNRTQTDEL